MINPNFSYKIVGLEKDLKFLFKKVKYALIAFGGIKKTYSREAIFKRLKKIGYKLPTIQSKHSYVSKNSKISEGTIIMNGSFINFGSKIGKNCIINSKAIIEHDVIVGDNTQISPVQFMRLNFNWRQFIYWSRISYKRKYQSFIQLHSRGKKLSRQKS